MVGKLVFVSMLVCATSAFAQSESAGVNQYFNNCASCHESGGVAIALTFVLR